METRDNWIENILNSSNGKILVSPNDDLISKINCKIEETKVVSLRTLWLVAASTLLLLGLNLLLVTKQNKINKNESSVFEKTLNQSNQFYN